MTSTLALHGGPKTVAETFPPWPRLSDRARAEAAATLASGRLVQSAGTRVAAFESAFAASLDATGQGGVKRAFEAWRRWRRAPAMSLAFAPEILAGWQQVDLDGGGVGLVVKVR